MLNQTQEAETPRKQDGHTDHDALCHTNKGHKLRRPDHLRISHSELLKRFSYVNGEMVRILNIGGGSVKHKVGRVKSTGYHSISIDGVQYLTHHLVWFFHYERWPIEIDHIDRNKLNNRIENLRECTRSENQNNMEGRIYKKGVSAKLHKLKGGIFRATIKINKERIDLGIYGNREKASRALIKRLKDLGLFSREDAA